MYTPARNVHQVSQAEKGFYEEPSRWAMYSAGASGLELLWSPTPMTKTILMYLVVMAVVVLVISFVWVSKQRKGATKEKDFSFEVDADQIVANILDRAIELNSKFDLVCTRSSITQKHIQCHGIAEMHSTNTAFSQGEEGEAEEDTQNKEKRPCNPYLTLRLVPGSLYDGWDHAPIDVYLQLVQNGQGTLYHFASFVCKIMEQGGEKYIVIQRPSILGDSQSREEVRIEPAPESVALASAWLYAKDTNMLADKVQGLGKAFGMFRPDGESDFRIINISACGIRLRFLRDDIEKLPFAIEKHMELCLFLVVNTEQEKSKRLFVWLKAECKGLAPCTDPDCVDVRFSFTHWQQIYERTKDITWNVATLKDRVPPIMHWIMHSAYGMYGDKHIIENNQPAAFQGQGQGQAPANASAAAQETTTKQ